MAIKLKRLNKNFGFRDTYIKIFYILLMVLSTSIFIETVVFLLRDRFYLFRSIFENIFTNYGLYYSTTVRKFILFGPGVYMDNRWLSLGILFVLIASFRYYCKNRSCLHPSR